MICAPTEFLVGTGRVARDKRLDVARNGKRAHEGGGPGVPAVGDLSAADERGRQPGLRSALYRAFLREHLIPGPWQISWSIGKRADKQALHLAMHKRLRSI